MDYTKYKEEQHFTMLNYNLVQISYRLIISKFLWFTNTIFIPFIIIIEQYTKQYKYIKKKNLFCMNYVYLFSSKKVNFLVMV